VNRVPDDTPTKTSATAQKAIPVIRPRLADGVSAERNHAPASTHVARTLALGVLALLLVAAVLVFFVLPRWVSERSYEVDPTPSARVSEPSAQALEVAAQKREAERVLGEVLRQQTALEAEGIAIWADQEFEAVLGKLATADVLFSESRFSQATEIYRQTLATLNALDQSRPDRLQDALDLGGRALGNADGAEALRQFGIALALDGANETARRGAQRAQTIEEVAALLAGGEVREKNGELDQAKADYEQALALDQYFKQGRNALRRVEQKIADRAFQRAMSKTLAAIDGGDLNQAKRFLADARRLRPNAGEVEETGLRLAAARQRYRLNELKQQGRALEHQERWREAADKYAAALAIDPLVAFAVEGRQRSLEMAAVSEQLERYVNEPERLESAAPLANAKRLLESLKGLPDPGPELKQKLVSLERMIAQAGTPVPVLLQSDNETEVTLYKVGRFGRFSRRQLQLLPGKYTAVGARAGYRDVRVEFRVAPGKPAGPVVIRCEERI
jgi:tetratricopeptide (TPR) repeat protein